MKIGYPCINRSIGCTAGGTFRLASYSKEKLIAAVKNNLFCLSKILEYNVSNDLLFFRISSDLVPFASHPICRFNWASYFKQEFQKLGEYIKENEIRISMHPDQFVLINSLDKKIVEKSIKELEYQCKVLDVMNLNNTAKVQVHVGGVYGNKEKSIERFIKNYNSLPETIKKRVAIENDDRSYSLKDCLYIHKAVGIPVIFDVFHHECLNNGEPLRDAVIAAKKTWDKNDGFLMVDYSSQKKGKRKGTHAESINIKSFKEFFR